MMKKTLALGLVGAGAALVAGCHRGAPAGQVAATVNGQEVTLQEINTELQAANLPPNADKQAVQRAVLQRIIDRKLLVGAAEDKKLDKTPEFLAQRRRMDELMLAQAFAKQQLTAVPVPTAADIDKFMADHPNVFAQREQWALDQIRFAPPQNQKALEALAQDHSMAAVAARLTALGITFTRGTAAIDTGTVPPPVLAEVNKLPATEPFVVPQPGLVTVNIITARKPIPLDVPAARQGAAQSWRQAKYADLIQQQLFNDEYGYGHSYGYGAYY